MTTIRATRCPSTAPSPKASPARTLRAGSACAVLSDPPFDYAALCPRAPRVTRLETPIERVRFAVGESWLLARLVVVAVDDHGRPLPDVPIVLDLSRADSWPDLWPPARLQAQEPASLRLRIRTLCAPNQRELVVPLEIGAAERPAPSDR